MTLPDHSYYCLQFGWSSACPRCAPESRCKNCGHVASDHLFSPDTAVSGWCAACRGCGPEKETTKVIYPEDDPHLAFVLEGTLDTTRSGYFRAMVNLPWIVHPTKGLVLFYSGGSYYPQANQDVAVTTQLCHNLYPWAEVKLIPLVLLLSNGAPVTKEI